jgi:hypothetical protein
MMWHEAQNCGEVLESCTTYEPAAIRTAMTTTATLPAILIFNQSVFFEALEFFAAETDLGLRLNMSGFHHRGYGCAGFGIPSTSFIETTGYL